jgi:hypothetical protein
MLIACLRPGAPAATPAVTAASNVQRTITGVRIGLLVGIVSSVPIAR